MGFHTVAISRGKDKEELAKKLGAHDYIDSAGQDQVAELFKLGGADLILATAPSGKAIEGVLLGLSGRGKLMLVAAAPDQYFGFSVDIRRPTDVAWPRQSTQ